MPTIVGTAVTEEDAAAEEGEAAAALLAWR